MYDAVSGRRNRGRHAVEEALDVVTFLGIERDETCFPLSFPRRDLSESAPRVALVPCSRWAAKNWAPEHFVEVGTGLVKQYNASIFVLGEKGDMETCRSIAFGIGERVKNLCGKTSLVELGSLMQEMHLVITVDSGPMHMAAALDVPVLAVFGATDPKRTGPYGSKHSVLVPDESAEIPDLARAYKRDSAADWRIAPKKVLETALTMLELQSLNDQ